MNYYLGHWRWDATEDAYCPPVGAVGAIDLGAVTDMGTRAASRPGCLCWSQDRLPSEYTLLGTGDVRQIRRSPLIVDALASLTAGKKRPAGATLQSLIHNCLTDCADPLGEGAPRVAEPAMDGWCDLWLWGHGRVHGERFEWGTSTHTALVQASLRKQFAEMFHDAHDGKLRDDKQHLRVLDFWCEQHKIDDWRQFVPQALHKHVPGRVRHETTITDTFDRTNASSLGTSSGGWSWANGAISGWGISSNKANATVNGNLARAQSDLSSANHYAAGDVVTSGTTAAVGLCVRYSTSADTHYNGWGRNNSSPTYRLRKVVSSTPTNLNDVSTTAFSSGTLKIEINGTSLALYKDGVVVNGPVTDSSIAGNLRTGLINSVATGGTVDNFQASDLSASSIVYVQLERWARGYARGIWTKR